MWWLGVGGRETFYNHMIRSLSFSDPVPLACDIHKCFSVPHLQPLVETENLEGTEVG